MAMGIITTPIIVNAVGKEQFGFIVLAGTITGYLTILGLGMPGAVIKYIAEFNSKKDDENITKTINSSLVLFSIIGLFIFLTIIVFINSGGLKLFNISQENYNSAKKVLYVASFLALFSWPSMIFQHSLEGLQEYHKLNIIQLISRIIGILCTVIVALLKFPVEIIFLVSNLTLIISRFCEYIYLKKIIPYWKIKLRDVNKKIFKLLFSFSIWLLILQISSILTYQTDKIIVGVMLPMAMLTYYYVLIRPIQLIKSVTSFLRVAIMPAASERHALKGNKGIDNLIYKGSKYYIAFNVPLSIIGFFLCKPFIQLWMGSEYVQYIFITRIYCISLIFLQINGLLGEIYFGTGRAKKLSFIGISQSIFNVIISIYFVKLIGLPGVILGTIVSAFLERIAQFIILFKDLKISKLSYIKNVIFKGQLPAIIFGLILLPLWNYFNTISSWIELIAIGTILIILMYIVSFIFVVEKEDKKFIISSIKSIKSVKNLAQ